MDRRSYVDFPPLAPPPVLARGIGDRAAWHLVACRPWHVREGAYARAFARTPRSWLGALRMFARGWRPFDAHSWSKGSRNLRLLCD
jgi:hypothetical protein